MLISILSLLLSLLDDRLQLWFIADVGVVCSVVLYAENFIIFFLFVLGCEFDSLAFLLFYGLVFSFVSRDFVRRL